MDIHHEENWVTRAGGWSAMFVWAISIFAVVATIVFLINH